jgi:hypothetical protein
MDIQKPSTFEQRSAEAQAKAAQAYSRLLNLAETRDSGQVFKIASFLAATYNGNAWKFDLFDLRILDVAISDDMLACLDALRWGKADLYQLVPDGDKRVQAVIKQWGMN